MCVCVCARACVHAISCCHALGVLCGGNLSREGGGGLHWMPALSDGCAVQRCTLGNVPP